MKTLFEYEFALAFKDIVYEKAAKKAVQKIVSASTPEFEVKKTEDVPYIRYRFLLPGTENLPLFVYEATQWMKITLKGDYLE